MESRACCGNYLIEVPLLFVKGCAGSVGPLHIEHEVLDLILEPLLGLLKGGALGIHSFYVFLSILQTLGQLLPEKLVSVSDQEQSQNYCSELYKAVD